VIALRRLALVLIAAAWTAEAAAQENPAVDALRRAYADFQLDSVVRQARRLLDAGQLSRIEMAQVWELSAFAYAAMDSSTRAVESFRELIRLDPEREPDVRRVAPRITSLYASALGQVLVIRHLRADTVSFIAGTGALTLQFQVSRSARITARVVGPGLDVVLDSASTASGDRVVWQGMAGNGEPVANGRYQIVIAASAGRDAFEIAQAVDVARAVVDTLPHVTQLEQYQLRPEMVPPPRSFRPLVLTGLFFGVTVGVSSVLQNPTLGGASGPGLVAVGAASLLAGGALSLRQPEPVRVETNVLYNQLVRNEIARRNDDISRQNADRQGQTLLTMTPVPRRP
jgi:hypothetical protein